MCTYHLSLLSPHISHIVLILIILIIYEGGISIEELDVALSSNVRQYSSLQQAFIAADRNEDDELDRIEFRHNLLKIRY